MKSQVHALAVVLGFIVLALLVPILNIFSLAAVALVSLRKGVHQGLILALLGSVAVYLIASMQPQHAVRSIVFDVYIPALAFVEVCILGLVLRATRSMSHAVGLAAIVSTCLVIITYLVAGNTTQWWSNTLNDLVTTQFASAPELDQLAMKEQFDKWTPVLTGFISAVFMAYVVVGLFIGRWWQAILYNPGGFKQEFHALQLGKTMAIGALIIALVSLLPEGELSYLATNIVMVIVTMYLIQGIAVAHAVVELKHLQSIWLVVLYIIVLLMAQVIAVAGYIDTWFDFRKRAANGSSS